MTTQEELNQLIQVFKHDNHPLPLYYALSAIQLKTRSIPDIASLRIITYFPLKATFLLQDDSFQGYLNFAF